MAKQKQARRLGNHQAQAVLRGVKTSPQKARLVLDLIRGKSVEHALTALKFSKKKAARLTLGALESAIANAENNHNLNVDKLVVDACFADKGLVMKRGRPRARGRFGKILKPTCHITVVVAEKE
ncbi:MAG: 50S ribosomal protein L22 [Proteobacteria bacterium]|jgi:large subunit ribosomal protein L22|nr:MAG: 50S ribosomal protein L22 [Pseudomonadota bacterium]|tara:strand:- start:2249 stop:2620 length:372 start_codon:yes stop_codon:yes gene_type:complete